MTAVFMPGSKTPIGRLERNFFRGNSRQLVDAAVFRLLAPGRRLLARASASVPTSTTDAPVLSPWTSKVVVPNPGDQGEPVLIWPSHVPGLSPFEEFVTSYAASEYRLLRGVASTKLIQVVRCTQRGDSGAPMYREIRSPTGRPSLALYGLCSGAVGRFSYFTPVLPMIERLQRAYGKKVYLWVPDANVD
ncbi:MAG: hypothetical protein ACPG4T_05335 [Nannocystaceae bacterium]